MNPGIKTGTILDRIVESRREEVEHRKRAVPLAALRMAVEKNKATPVRDFAGALARPGLNVIAELKKASPSRGALRADFDPSALARELEQAGAAALSVLTEEEFFQGALEHLKTARRQTAVPALRKDFIFEEWQVWESRAAGADSFLLIAAILSDAQLSELLALGRELGIEPLIEVHTGGELERALAAGARVVGVNNRDLKNFEERTTISLELIGAIPDRCLAVSESGLRSHDALQRLREAGFDAFLVGEHLMRATDPAAALRELLGVQT